MIAFKKMKIGTKLVVSISLLVIVAIAIISATVGFNVYRIAETDTQSLAKEIAYRYANAIKSNLEMPLDEVRALASVFQAATVHRREIELTREKANTILKHFIETNTNFLGVYVLFEPNAFDGKDAEFAGTPQHDETGRFIVYWTRKENGEGFSEVPLDYEVEGPGDYYQIPKKTRREAIIEPYVYPVQGKDVLMTSLIVPIFDEKKHFLGIAGIDLDLESLHQSISKNQITAFKNGFFSLYSSKGVIISIKKADLVGKNVRNTNNNDDQFVDFILHNEPFVMERTSNLLDEPVISYGAPLEIGYTGTHWVVVANLPKRELLGEAIRLVKTIVLLGAVITLITILVLYLLSRSFTRPLLQVNNQLRILSQGQLTEEKLIYQNDDEIAEMIRSVHQLKEGVKATIEQAKAIAAGNYSTEVKLLSNEDELGQSLSKMIFILREVVQQANAIAVGDYSKEVKMLSEQDQLGQALSHMTRMLRDMTAKNADQDWLKTGLAQLNEQMSGEQEVIRLTKNIISFLTTYLEATVGLFYLLKTPSTKSSDEDSEQKPYLQLVNSYAYIPRENTPNQFIVGEGLVGEVALTRKSITCTHAPEEYTYITRSSLSQAVPRYVILLPVLYENEIKGVIEIGLFEPLPEIQQEFLNQAIPAIGIAVNTAKSRTRMKELLDSSQQQSQELQSRQAELQQVNTELQTQAEELQTQQEELRQTNDELEHRTQDLERQKDEIRKKNTLLEKTQADMEKARTAIEAKAKELELASKYKSEFLANMSHELRTPLNSLLILAQLLAQNKGNTLTPKQVEYAQTIHGAGADLLNLINDILDLSKVEAGKVEAVIEEVSLANLLKGVEQKFRHVAEEKKVNFEIIAEENLPLAFYTDGQRIKQIINNLLSNAFKFTHQGSVTFTIERPKNRDEATALGLICEKTLAFSVADTGIGIPEDKRMVIFEAFQQVDGTTSRKYGGTGLGLSISRQLSRLLGGDLKVTSNEDKGGSIFTLYLPELSKENNVVVNKMPTQKVEQKIEPVQPVNKETEKSATPTPEPVIDDRNNLKPDDKILLIVEDDRRFSQILMEISKEKGFKCLIAEDGGMGLQLADEYRPAAIILDVTLHTVGGWTVMEKLKSNPNTRHIPVHFISGTDQKKEAKQMGAIGYALKPVGMGELGETFKRIEQVISKTLKKVLIAVDNPDRQQKMIELVGGNEVKTTVARDHAEVYRQLHEISFDCMVVDLDVEQKTGVRLLEDMQRDETLSQLPIIVYSERQLTPEENNSLQKYAKFLTVKSVKSPERLVEEVTLFLHQVESSLPLEKQRMLRTVYDKESIFAHKKVLLVDDDSRNVFALVVTLDEKGMEVLTAENGIEALEILKQPQNIDIVLMDIMMPEMDGYETMRRIRAQPHFRRLPIIALTAKAMKEDKAKCIEAGANDYLAKPVDTSKLLSLMRVWLYQ